MFKIITVRPSGSGWCVSGDLGQEPALFASGAKAEAAARQRALDLANCGQPVKIEIWLRDGRLAGRLICTTASDAFGVAA